MRNVTQLHPELQKKVVKLQQECLKQGIKIKIGECVRTVAEQDALYAKGRTVAGSIVTNAKGSTYSSMHQWGVAFDFYLGMDVDKDGKTSDDAFNNATGLFNKVGAIGKELGLEWGGDWKSIKDLPHFQLPDWGSTSTKLKSMYGTPMKFMSTWNNDKLSGVKNKPTNTHDISKNQTEPARSMDKEYVGTYGVVNGLNLRAGAGFKKSVIIPISKGSKVKCYGYYTNVGNNVWLYVSYGKYTGFALYNRLLKISKGD